MRSRSTVLAAALLIALVAIVNADGSTDPQPPPKAAAAAVGISPAFASTLARARLATAKYATSLSRARADGYKIITRSIPHMGWHFMNAKITGFDVTKPPILVYERRGKAWTLGALEWVFPSMPATPPLPGAKYGVFPAACHYADGTFVPKTAEADCAATNGAFKFTFWHPQLVTMHVWLWYPNPDGLYSGTNSLVAPFDNG
jgi:hypothetical protein